MQTLRVEKTSLLHLLGALETLKRMDWKMDDMGVVWYEDWTRYVY